LIRRHHVGIVLSWLVLAATAATAQQTYSPSIEAGRLALSRRVRRTTTATSSGTETVEETAERNPVAPADPLRVIRRSVTTTSVSYRSLPPGSDHFAVSATDNNGIWSDGSATTELIVLPAFDQTTWFRAIAVGLFLALLWAAYRFRMDQVQHAFDLTLEARIGERTRIARELHDTLLQNFQGLVLRFQSASTILPARPDEAKARLDRALEQAEAAMAEGRDAVQGLRASAATVNHLANGIAAVGVELTSDPSAVHAAAIEVEVDGESRDLNPVVRDEAYRIASEALRNAVKHAHAHRIVVTIHYEARQFRLTVRDDGKGMDGETVQRQVAGHFGLSGMHERAALVRGRLAVRSAIGSGTEIEVRIPGATAYGVSERRSWRSRRRR
jgi:signal transduction histidine kinase